MSFSYSDIILPSQVQEIAELCEEFCKDNTARNITSVETLLIILRGLYFDPTDEDGDDIFFELKGNKTFVSQEDLQKWVVKKLISTEFDEDSMRVILQKHDKKNKNGFSLEEFITLFNKMEMKLPLSEVKKIFDTIKTGKDIISFQDITKFMHENIAMFSEIAE